MDLYNNIKNNKANFFLLAGPCVIENKEMPFEIAEKLIEITNKLNIQLIFKASYRKANRSSVDSFTGIGDFQALNILSQIREKYLLPVVTDIHTAEEARMAAQYVDIIQIPAFLSRQTDILLAAGETGKIVNIKKGQFLSADSMKYVVEKLQSTGNNKIMLTDRGTMFGYQDLIVDFRSIPIMQENNLPVIMDITHSLQQPNQESGVSGGQPRMIETIAKAAIAVGSDGIFMETHPNPSQAKSDGKNMIALENVEELLTKLVKIKQALI